MQAFGSDRMRDAGEHVVLLSSIDKGWTPRVLRSGTHAEFPGTAILWEEQFFEVVEATHQPSGAIRYVLKPWREDHTIRTFEAYDEPSEAARLADYERARRQRRASALSRASGLLLGHLPFPVQNHLQNELGVSPSGMTMLSCVGVIAFVAVCATVSVGAMIDNRPNPLPMWIGPLSGLLMLESLVRLRVAMSQSRGMGSMAGTLLYILYWLAGGRRAVSPFEAPGEATVFVLEPSAEIAQRDALAMREPFLTLLPRRMQEDLASRCGFDYRRQARIVAGVILAFSLLGVIAGLDETGSAGGLTSLILASVLAVEQVLRLFILRNGPAPSILGPLVIPLAAPLLRR